MSFNSLLGLGSHSAPSTLEGFYPMLDNAASTTVLDYSGNGRDGTLAGAGNTSASTTTGPNNWNDAALDLDGTNDHIEFPSTLVDGIETSDEYTIFIFGRFDSTSGTPNIFQSTGSQHYIQTRLNSGSFQYRLFDGSIVPTINGSSASTSTWYSIAQAYGTSGIFGLKTFLDGSSDGAGGSQAANFTDLGAPEVGENSFGSVYMNGQVACLIVSSAELSSSDVADLDAGPEPIVVSGSDSVSGEERVGSTLSASGATWGLDSPYGSGTNGTITYGYQWTRSDDGTGTNEADISGATSSTYTPVSADIGKYLRRRTRATNDGGFDSAADHNSTFTGAILAGARQTLTLTGVGR